MKKQSNKRKNDEKPEEIIDEITSSLDDLHKEFVGVSEKIGYARDSLYSIRPIAERLGDSTSTDPGAVNLYRDDLDILYSIRDEVNSLMAEAYPFTSSVIDTAGSAISYCSSTSTTASFVFRADANLDMELPVIHPFHHLEDYSERISNFDYALGKTYREIWEILYGTRSDPERAALYLIRQAFDQIFFKLSPDDDVRASSFWSEKEGDTPNQIWRIERIHFAANTHVKNKLKAKTLLASSKHMLDVYKSLNEAHNRGEINRVRARKALEEMRNFIEDWISAIEF
jgi:hypothetical protein